MPAAVLDTTVLSNFAHIRRPDLLQAALGGDAVTTALILAELRAGETLGLVPRCDWRPLRVVTLTDEEMSLAASYAAQLDAGEASCLAVAKARAWVLVTDDFAARRLAEREGVAVSGTLGALRQLITLDQLTFEEADRYLAEMLGHGYRAPVRSLRDL